MLLVLAELGAALVVLPVPRAPPRIYHASISCDASRTVSSSMQVLTPSRVAVVGAGIGGLALARALRTLETGVEEVVVFDRRDELRPGMGGGIQINGGAAILSRLGLGEQLKEAALPVRRIWSRKSNGFELLDLDVDALVRSEPSLLDGSGTPQAFSIMRDALQATRREHCALMPWRLPSQCRPTPPTHPSLPHSSACSSTRFRRAP